MTSWEDTSTFSAQSSAFRIAQRARNNKRDRERFGCERVMHWQRIKATFVDPAEPKATTAFPTIAIVVAALAIIIVVIILMLYR